MKIIPFASFMLAQHNGNAVNLGSADIRLALITAATAPLPETHDFWDDLNAGEVSGTNYTAGGVALASKTITYVAAVGFEPGYVKFDAADISIAQSGGGFTDARYGILKVHNATASLSRLIAFFDMISDKGNVGGAFAFAWNSTGILKMRLPTAANVT